MPEDVNTEHAGAALLTVNLLDHSKTPDELSDAILETLIEMSAEARINIWHKLTGINLESLAALYSMYDSGAGYRRVRLYGQYEASRTKRLRRRRR